MANWVTIEDYQRGEKLGYRVEMEKGHWLSND